MTNTDKQAYVKHGFAGVLIAMMVPVPSYAESKFLSLIVMCRVACFILVVVTMSGCASVSGGTNPSAKPFGEFTAALVELQKGTDQAINLLESRTEDRFRARVLEELQDKEDTEKPLVRSLILKMDSNNDLNIVEAPYFLVVPLFLSGTHATTQALIDYSLLLSQLADPNLLPAETFSTLKTDLNANSKSAMSAMNPKISASALGTISVFSDLASKAAEIYLRNKRTEDLNLVIEQNQSAVVKYAKHMQDAVNTVAKAIVQEYQSTQADLTPVLFDKSKRVKALNDYIQLDKDHVAAMSTLRQLHGAFGKVPKAHLSLVTAKESKGGLEAIIDLVETGKALQKSYSQTVAAVKSERVQAEADKSSALADAMEAEAEVVAMKAAQLKVDALKAQIDADNDPGNTGKAAEAEELRKAVAALQKDAQRKRENALALREAANAVQETATEVKKTIDGKK